MTKTWDVIIVGGGAAGLMAATSAARRGRRTLLLEKNSKLGVKILMSGGTRCNITHACDRRGIVEAFGKNGKFLHSALAALPPEQVVAMIETEGVHTKVESTGKIFPVSDRAIDVRDALVRMARKAGADLRTNAPVDSVCEQNGQFEVEAAGNRWTCSSLIVAVGGKSYPGCGTTGDGYAWAHAFGHSIVPTRPALTPIVSHTPWLHALKGVSLQDIETTVSEVGSGKRLNRSSADLLFTHFGLSGPAPMNLSREVTARDNPQEVELAINLFPQTNRETLFERFREAKRARPQDALVQLVPGGLPRRFVRSLFEYSNIDSQGRLAEVRKEELRRLANTCSALCIPVHGTLGYKKAEVTAGGADLSEVDSKSMQSRLRDGLFLAGEILDLDGPIGGFNFQSAFSTGWLAGASC